MRIGSLFSGYGGLDIATQNVLGGDLAWYSEIEPAACKVLAAHYPSIPNLGDIKTVDWATVPSIDVLTGGYPCQPFSTAGLRKGKDDERHLWPYVKDAISHLRPRLVILENVRGHLSMGLADVIADLAEVGFDARWGLVRASDAGAPHNRARVFITAYPTGLGSDDRAVVINPRTFTPPRLQASPRRSGFDYGDAIGVWAQTLGRLAPATTDRGFLNPSFVEWMMGLPEGHVTGHDLTLSQTLKLLGNGVCPQQAEIALTTLLAPP